MSIVEMISENFLILFYSVLVVMILAIIAKILNTREREKTQRQLADINMKNRKLEMVEKERHINNLKEASTVLSDSEKEKLDKISQDKSILSRRSLYLMNEIEERMQRLERGADNAKLTKTLEDIKNVEDDLFGKEVGERK